MHHFAGVEFSFIQHLVKVLAVLSGMVGVFLVSTYLWKKFRFSQKGAQPLIQILETHYLAPKKTLHIVAVGPTRFLLGSTADHLTLLMALPAEDGGGTRESHLTTNLGSLPGE